MEGVGSHRALGVESPDPVLELFAALGLAAAVGTALVVDFGRRQITTRRTLADLVLEGPTLDELSPARAGVALLAAGAVESGPGLEMIAKLAGRWPAVVVKSSPAGLPTVPVRSLLPGLLAELESLPAVWQSTPLGPRPPGPGPVLPPIGSRMARGLLLGRAPRQGRWLRVWSRVWEMPWA